MRASLFVGWVQDTHYLLYIYDRMKNELISTSQARAGKPAPAAAAAASSSAASASTTTAASASSTGSSGATAHLLLATLERSQNVCLSKYEKEVVTPTSHHAFCVKNGLVLSDSQMRVLGALFVWRDNLARKEDESTK
jgi:hypothetical protein